MKYLKEPITNRIISGKNFGVFFDSWKELTQSEIDAYELEKVKLEKLSQCQAYLSSTDWQVIRFSARGYSSLHIFERSECH